MQKRGVIPQVVRQTGRFPEPGCSVREGTNSSKGRHGEEREDQGLQCHSPSSSNPFRESRKSPTSISNSLMPDLSSCAPSPPRCRMAESSPPLRSRGHAQRRSYVPSPRAAWTHPGRFMRRRRLAGKSRLSRLAPRPGLAA